MISAAVLLATAVTSPAPIVIRPGTVGGGASTPINFSSLSGASYGILNAGLSWTSSAVSLGSADADRKIVACVSYRSSETGKSLDVMTIGGVSATLLHDQEVSSGSNYFYSSVWIASVPTGATGDVVISPDGSAYLHWVNFYLYRLVGAESTASATAQHSGSGSTTITVAAGGVIIGSGASALTGGSTTPTGLDEDYDVNTDLNDDTAAAGSHESASGESNRTVRLDMGSATYDSAAFVAIDPSS